jgi:hypothetical protein
VFRAVHDFCFYQFCHLQPTVRTSYRSDFCSSLWSHLRSSFRLLFDLIRRTVDIPFSFQITRYPTHHSSRHRWQRYRLSSTSSAPVATFFNMNRQTRLTRGIDCLFHVYHVEFESTFTAFRGYEDAYVVEARLKCDKGNPCESCTKRGDESYCSYRNDPNTNRTKNVLNGSSSRAQERLQHLEGLVMQLMQSETPVKAVSMPGSAGVIVTF